MKKTLAAISLFLLIFLLPYSSSRAEEGMWPVSEIHKLKLKRKGLRISPKKIFNPHGVSLIDGIVQVGGCSGSFVSEDGLILTNHHCAYRAVQAASTEEHDYIRNGFLARTRSEEIEARGITARVTESYRDVSDEVLSAVSEDMDFAQRTKAVEKKIKEIVKKAEKENPGKRAEVAEMFSGKTYVLFIYTYLKDIRLVYVPPRSIGEFGGEVDNWMWPRHSGDFSFMRAYVAPDGSPAEYSPENIPYHPRKVIKVSPRGVDEGDFVFILGYPGRTYRHRTSDFVSFEEEIRMPFVVDWYGWQISVMEKMSERKREVALKHLGRIKGLANTLKNYRGKLQGLRRVSLVEKKREEEKALQEFIDSDPELKAEYGTVLQEIKEIYEEMREKAEYELLLNYLRRSVNMLNFALTAWEASSELQKEDLERKPDYMERNFSRTKRRLELALENYYEPTDRVIFKEMLMRAARLPREQRIKAFDSILEATNLEKSADRFIESAYSRSKLAEKGVLMAMLDKKPEKLRKTDDPFLRLAEKLYPVYQELEEREKARKGALDTLYARLIEVKKKFLKKEFIPDANRTLRLTFGRIRGYQPRDGVWYQPLTTLRGVIEKTTGVEPFDTPPKIMELYRRRDFGQFEHPELKSVPVCILYDTDTTGGNSGSPVLNSRGQLVGINFDRTFEATINDFAWNESYSRSIAVDIRYVFWITHKFSGVDYLLEEMGVKVRE
ncbi:MAG: S46 family peptidase [Candidatus Aminicenantales bacterium]